MRKNIAQPDRSQLTTWRMRIACWIPKSANRHSEYVILMAFPLRLWLHERVSMLRYRYIAPHVYTLCFPDGKAITPVCVCCVSARSDRRRVRVFSPKARLEKISLHFAAHIQWRGTISQTHGSFR